eukprot:m.89936 g.89936  ORF g.89936 m.89936 type:complete len:205 (-) comp20108_c1_seq1:1158-1772(-)
MSLPGPPPRPPPPPGGSGDDDDNEVRQTCYGIRGQNDLCRGLLLVFAHKVSAVQRTKITDAWLRVVVVNEKRDLDGRPTRALPGTPITPPVRGHGANANTTQSSETSAKPPKLTDDISNRVSDQMRDLKTTATDLRETVTSPEFQSGVREALSCQADFIVDVVVDVCSGKQLVQTATFTGKLVSGIARDMTGIARDISDWYRNR